MCTVCPGDREERGGLIPIILYGNPNGVSGIHATVINNNSSNSTPVVLLNPHVFTVFILLRNKINISKAYNTISTIVPRSIFSYGICEVIFKY